MKFYAAAFSSLLFAAACGGGGGGGETKSQPSFAEMAGTTEGLITRMNQRSATPVRSMPTTGSASYTGIAAFAPTFYDDIDTLAEARLNANFANSTITGDLTNFRDYENNVLAGSVAIQNGVISENQFSADLRGNLSSGGTSVHLDAEMEGGFLGPNADMMVAAIEGTAGNGYFAGALVAEKN